MQLTHTTPNNPTPPSRATEPSPTQPSQPATSGKLMATLVHFALSAAVVGALWLVVRYYWFPGDYFWLAGGWEGMKIVIAVDLVLGPLLTAVVYRRGKPRLLQDLALIGLIQLLALGAGGYLMGQKKPRVIAYTEQGFFVVSQYALDQAASALEREGIHYPALSDFDQQARTYVWVAMPPGGYGEIVTDVLNRQLPDLGARIDRYRPFDQAQAALEQQQWDWANLPASVARRFKAHLSSAASEPSSLQVHRLTTEFDRGFALYDPEQKRLVALAREGDEPTEP